MNYSDEGDTSSSSSEAGGLRVPSNITQLAPPPSPILPDISRSLSEVSNTTQVYI